MKEYLVDRKGMKNLREMDQVFERKYLHVCHRSFFVRSTVFFTYSETAEWHDIYTNSKYTIYWMCHYNWLYSLVKLKFFLSYWTDESTQGAILKYENIKLQFGWIVFMFDLGLDELSAWSDLTATVFIRVSWVTVYHIALKLGRTHPHQYDTVKLHFTERGLVFIKSK